jgi:hypothetical protein
VMGDAGLERFEAGCVGHCGSVAQTGRSRELSAVGLPDMWQVY